MIDENVCNNFQKNPDGSWTSVGSTRISNSSGGEIQIGPGMTFNKGVQFMGVDLATYLDDNCA